MDVSVVILTFNSENYLKNCLNSIFSQTKDVEFEVIVVDNQSSDKTVEIAKSFGVKVKLIISPENGGFSKGNNLGIKAASGKYVLLLNPDTVFLENTLDRMKLWMDAHEEVAVSSCQLVNSEGKISPTGGSFPELPKVLAWGWFLDDLPLVRNYFVSYHPHPGPMYEKEFFPDWVTGAFFFVRKEAIKSVGMLDENIFMYAEELEWCMRFRKAGFKVGYTPITKVVHLERGSVGGAPKGAILGEFKGLKYIYGKYYSEWQQVALGTILDVGAFLRVILWLVRFKPQMARIYLEALLL